MKLKNFFKKKNENHKIFEKYKGKEHFVPQDILFHGKKITVPDCPSFAYQVREIFIDEVYKFQCDKPNPIIYDCGSNVGTSILYFKQLYPDCIIKGFEADEKIFSSLTQNVSDLPGVELHHNAVWINEDELCFNSQGADGGSLQNSFDAHQTVKAIRLRDWLEKETRIDLLKMDIEGAETAVLKDCQNVLGNVDRIFVEYHSILGTKQTLDTILNILSENGFRYYLEGMIKKRAPFVKEFINVNMDLQVSIWAKKEK